MTGMIQCKCFFMCSTFWTRLLQQYSHWRNIHELHPDFLIIVQSWPAFLYAGCEFNSNNPSKGLFKGKILVKVGPVLEYIHCYLFYTSGLQSYIYFPDFHRLEWSRDWKPQVNLSQEMSQRWKTDSYKCGHVHRPEDCSATCHCLCSLPGMSLTHYWAAI